MPALRYLPEAGLRSSQTRFDYSDAAKLLTVSASGFHVSKISVAIATVEHGLSKG